MSTTVNWLIKGTLAVVTVQTDEVVYEPLRARFLMGPDSHEVLDEHNKYDAKFGAIGSTAAEAREAWLAAGGKS